MAIVQIQNWLDGSRDYHEGVALYETHGKNKNLKRLFSKGRSHYNANKLLAELQRLAVHSFIPSPTSDLQPVLEELNVDLNLQVEPSSGGSPTRYSETSYIVPDHKDLPPALQSLNIEKGKAFRKAAKLHRELDGLTSDHERFQSATAIVDLFDRINAIWDKIDHWLATGEILTDPNEARITIPENPGELLKRYNNLKTYISKANKVLPTITDQKKRTQKLDKLHLMEKELNLIKNKLGYA